MNKETVPCLAFPARHRAACLPYLAYHSRVALEYNLLYCPQHIVVQQAYASPKSVIAQRTSTSRPFRSRTASVTYSFAKDASILYQYHTTIRDTGGGAIALFTSLCYVVCAGESAKAVLCASLAEVLLCSHTHGAFVVVRKCTLNATWLRSKEMGPLERGYQRSDPCTQRRIERVMTLALFVKSGASGHEFRDLFVSVL
jgi:hypothetical protein